MSEIEKWIDDRLFSRWGWEGWMNDNAEVAFRNSAEKKRILSAARFLVRCLGNNEGKDTQYVVDSIVEQRSKAAK